jgi:hypothetical protein
MIPYELLQDLNKLVCSSKNRKIEDLFIKLANESQGDFYSWIIKNNKNQEIISKLNVPEVLSALNYLFNNGKELNSHPILIFLEMSGQKNKKLDPNFRHVYSSISEFYNLPSYKSIFLPFSNFFGFIKKNTEATFLLLHKDEVRKDIDLLINTYNRSINHHHMAPHEFKQDQGKPKDREINKKKQREITHTVYGFFLKHFTEEILTALSNQGMWDKLRSVLNDRQLADYTRVLDALPYTPSLKDSPQAIKTILDDIAKVYQNNIGENKVIKMGLVGFFNYARQKLFSSLGIWTSLPEGELSTFQKDIVDDKSYFESGGLPPDVDVMEYQEVENKPQGIQKYNEEDIKKSAYIWSVSILLSNLRQMLVEQRSSNF